VYPTFYHRCIAACHPFWEQAVRHPFVEALAAGTLKKSQIEYYLAQDQLYLRNYIKVCRLLADRAVLEADRTLFEESAVLSEEAELGVQEHLVHELQLEWRDEPPGAATRAYLEQENTAVIDPVPLVALAGATPCNVLYAEIGNRLLHRKDVVFPGHPFRSWLALYSDPLVQELAVRWIACLNRWAKDTSAVDQQRAIHAFRASMKCEVDFWQQAWEKQ